MVLSESLEDSYYLTIRRVLLTLDMNNLLQPGLLYSSYKSNKQTTWLEKCLSSSSAFFSFFFLLIFLLPIFKDVLVRGGIFAKCVAIKVHGIVALNFQSGDFTIQLSPRQFWFIAARLYQRGGACSWECNIGPHRGTTKEITFTFRDTRETPNDRLHPARWAKPF